MVYPFFPSCSPSPLLLTRNSYCIFLSPTLWTFTVSNDLRACSSALFVIAERTPVVKKYRDALETVTGATMEFLACLPSVSSSTAAPEPTTSSPVMTARTPQQKHIDLNCNGLGVGEFSPGFAGTAQESYIRGSPRNGVDTNTDGGNNNSNGIAEYSFDSNLGNGGGGSDVFSYMPETQSRPGAVGRWEGRHARWDRWMRSGCQVYVREMGLVCRC